MNNLKTYTKEELHAIKRYLKQKEEDYNRGFTRWNIIILNHEESIKKDRKNLNYHKSHNSKNKKAMEDLEYMIDRSEKYIKSQAPIRQKYTDLQNAVRAEIYKIDCEIYDLKELAEMYP